MKKLKSCLAVAALAGTLLGMSEIANAIPTITVTPTLAPNAFGSPSYAAWVSNSFQAQYTGVSSFGTAGTPTYYQADSNVTSKEAIVTGFPSWLGNADPGTVYGPAFASELGNRMLFGLKIESVYGIDSPFSLADLSFSAIGTGGASGLTFGFGLGSYSCSLDYVCIGYGLDHVLGGGDDIFYYSGTPSVDAVIGRGSGSAYAAYCPGCTIEQQQAQIDAIWGYSGTFTGMYSLTGGASGSGTFCISCEESVEAPEPSTLGLASLGFGGLMWARRRRKQTAS